MAYDLYGNYYAREIDAINAEMAQCASIDAGIAERKMQEHDNTIYDLYCSLQAMDYKMNELEKRLKALEEKPINKNY